MIYLNQPETAFLTLTTMQAKVAIAYYFGRRNMGYEINMISLLDIGDKKFDQYEITSEGETYIYYEDVTRVFGRLCVIDLNKVDYPDPNSRYPLSKILGDSYEPLQSEARKQGINLAYIEVLFKSYSSDMVSYYIAAYYPQYSEIRCTAIKEFDKENDYPILHSYALFKLFIIHQIYHILDDHDFIETETDTTYKEDYYVPKSGIDCIDFSPIEQRSVAGEYVNYSFWIHQPGAFGHKNEIRAFVDCAQVGIKTGVFTLDEVIAAVGAAKPDMKTQKSLLAALENSRAVYGKIRTL